jgi:hypothetical protein
MSASMDCDQTPPRTPPQPIRSLGQVPQAPVQAAAPRRFHRSEEKQEEEKGRGMTHSDFEYDDQMIGVEFGNEYDAVYLMPHPESDQQSNTWDSTDLTRQMGGLVLTGMTRPVNRRLFSRQSAFDPSEH